MRGGYGVRYMEAMLLVPVAFAAQVTIAPGEDWCAAVNAAAPGDTVVLEAGDHAGPCTISASGGDAPITVEGHDSRIVYDGTNSNVVDLDASHLVLRGLAFGPTHADIDAIKIRSGEDLVIEGCSFTGIGGISISANSADTSRVQILDSTFTDLEATGLYLGCHDGSCASTAFRIEGNRFATVRSPDVGYAMETKLNSWGTIRGNIVSDAQGPAIEVYGSTAGDVTTVERNLLLDSVANATLELGGGPAIVRNNIVIGGDGAALYVYDYGGRGLVNDIAVQANTIVGAGAALEGWFGGVGLSFVNNAVSPALPDPIDGVTMDGNVACGDCWEGDSLWPLDGLVGAAVSSDPPVTEDWCGTTRPDPATVGALEPGGSGVFDAEADVTCPTIVAEEVDDPTSGCGCSSLSPTAGWGLLGLLSATGRSRRRPPSR